LSKEDWEIVYSSNLLRAKQTAEIIGAKIGNVRIDLDTRLREVGGGQIEGTTAEERIRKWGSSWEEQDLGIERSENVLVRGLSFIDEVTTRHHNKNILIVSHGSFIRHMLKELVPLINMEEYLKNTSLTILLKTDHEWNCELYNCTSHLD
jgi:probable phosphoglycerate mutase